MALRTIEVDGQTRPYADQLKWMGLTGVSYLPATAIPVGTTSEGLPVGLQIAGPYLEDRTPLAVARALAERLEGCPTPPGY